MLTQMKEMHSLEIPYSLPDTELKQHIAKLTQRMVDINTSIEAIWKSSIDFKDSTVAVSDLMGCSSIVTTISFINCQSEEWVEIG
jgi:hypothetical protein